MTQVTYSRLEEVLRSLGFALRAVEEKNKVYRHEATGALVVIPEFRPGESVLPRHLLAVRSILQAYGIADPTDFTTQLQKAS
jgi:predicted RNA binding protein YcfA (HicA-like mRNA interferase family)